MSCKSGIAGNVAVVALGLVLLAIVGGCVYSSKGSGRDEADDAVERASSGVLSATLGSADLFRRRL